MVYLWLYYRGHCILNMRVPHQILICCPMDLCKLSKDTQMRLLCSPSKAAHCILNESQALAHDRQGLIKSSPCLLLGPCCPHTPCSINTAFHCLPDTSTYTCWSQNACPFDLHPLGSFLSFSLSFPQRQLPDHSN